MVDFQLTNKLSINYKHIIHQLYFTIYYCKSIGGIGIHEDPSSKELSFGMEATPVETPSLVRRQRRKVSDMITKRYLSNSPNTPCVEWLIYIYYIILIYIYTQYIHTYQNYNDITCIYIYIILIYLYICIYVRIYNIYILQLYIL